MPGLRFVPLEGAERAIRKAVLTRPDTDSLATAAFMRAPRTWWPPAGSRAARHACGRSVAGMPDAGGVSCCSACSRP
jgi:hypothetical protein